MIGATWVVFLKEWSDALRDRRTLLMVLLSSVAIGPVVLISLSALIAGLESRAESREVWVAGIEHAPTLRNHLERQTFVVRAAPQDYERQLLERRLGEAVVVVPSSFEADLAAGERPQIEVVSMSADNRAEASLRRVVRLLRGFNQELAVWRLTHRGVSPALLEVVRVDERDLADPQARAARWTGMVPFFVLMAVLYGALAAALDTTAGERERGSLEPLLMTPAPRLALVFGKWGAVAAVGMLIAVLSSLSFLPAQALLRSETLAAMFQYGPREVASFVALLLPLAAAVSAVMMAVAIRCRTFKEAQSSNTIVVLVVSLLPMANMIQLEGEQAWHLWVPALAQVTLMGRVLKGEAMGAVDLLVPLVMAIAVAAISLADVVRQMRTAAWR